MDAVGFCPHPLRWLVHPSLFAVIVGDKYRGLPWTERELLAREATLLPTPTRVDSADDLLALEYKNSAHLPQCETGFVMSFMLWSILWDQTEANLY